MKALIAGCMLLLLGTPSWAQDAVPNPAPPHPELRPVLDDFGGMPGLTALMDSFMEIMLEDPRLRPFFEHTENDRIKRQLAEQFCVILGGDCVYTGRDMVESHKLFDAEFDVLEAMVGRVAKGVGEKLDPREARLKLEIAAEASRNPNIARLVREADACSLESLRQTIAEARRAHGLPDDDDTVAELAVVAAAMFDGLVIRGVRDPNTDQAAVARRFSGILRRLFLS